MIHAFGEMYEYTSRLPNIKVEEIKENAIFIWENRSGEDMREEWGSFQAFDRHGNTYFKSDIAKDLELNLNEQLLEEGYPIKLSVRQLSVSTLIGKVPTQTFEIVVLDNSRSEAQDPIWDWMIEYGKELN